LGSKFLFRSTEVGLDIMVNDHHSTSTCLTIAVPVALAGRRSSYRDTAAIEHDLACLPGPRGD